MPIKNDQYLLTQRNIAIRNRFQQYVNAGIPRMTAYVKTGLEFYLSGKSIRKILAKNA